MRPLTWTFSPLSQQTLLSLPGARWTVRRAPGFGGWPLRATYEHLAPLVAEVAGIPGDFAEFGVWRGTTFVPLAEAAALEGRACHAVDSFQGFAEPTDRDFDDAGECRYRLGGLSTGGSQAFRTLVAGLLNVVIHEGFIPAVLHACENRRGFAFIHIDLDQYEPTLHALRWAWLRTRPGGIVCCHDYLIGRTYLATAACNDWMVETGLAWTGYNPVSRHVWWRRP